MTYPADLDTITVRHKITDAGGRALAGNTVEAVPSARVWATDGSIVEYRTSTQIAADGTWELDLPYVDQEGIRNKGVPWKITEHVPGNPKSYLVAPVLAHGAGPIDAAEALVSAATSRQTVIQAGPVTDETAAGLLDLPGGQFAASLSSTIATGVAEQVPGAIADIPDVAAAVADKIQDRELVQATTVRRIIASENPNEPLQDGDLLLVLHAPTLMAFTDFSEHPAGAPPAGWESVWLPTTTEWQVHEDPAATGGKLLRFEAAAASRRSLAWTGAMEDLQASPDMEMLVRWRRVSGTPATYLTLRGSGANPAATGYAAGSVSHGAEVTMGRYLNGAYITIQNIDYPIGTEAWHRTRFRVEGDVVSMKVWGDSDPEPADWTHTYTNSSITAAGWPAITEPLAGVSEVDWVGLAVAGATAPSEAP